MIRIRSIPLDELLYPALELIVGELLLLKGWTVPDSLYFSLIVLVYPVWPVLVFERACLVRTTFLFRLIVLDLKVDDIPEWGFVARLAMPVPKRNCEDNGDRQP